MPYSMQLMLTLSSLLLARPRPEDGVGAPSPPTPDLSDVLDPALRRLKELAEGFRAQLVSPARAQQFERKRPADHVPVGLRSKWDQPAHH